MASDVKPPKDADDVPDALKPTVILMSVMIKIKVAPIVDEDDQESLQESISALLSDDKFADIVNFYLEDDDNLKELGFTPADAELIEENVVYDISD